MVFNSSVNVPLANRKAAKIRRGGKPKFCQKYAREVGGFLMQTRPNLDLPLPADGLNSFHFDQNSSGLALAASKAHYN